MKRISLFFIFFIFFPIIIFADFNIEDYKYFRNLESTDVKVGNFSFFVNEKIYSKTNNFLSDLKIINQDNKEINFSIEKFEDQFKNENFEEKISFIKEEGFKTKSFILDLGKNEIYHKSIRINTKSVDFRKFYQIYGSNKENKNFEKIDLENNNPNQENIILSSPAEENLIINYKYNNFRYIKAVFFGGEGIMEPDYFNLIKIKTTFTKGDEKNYNLKILENKEEDKKTKILVEVPYEKLPIDYFIIRTKEKDFLRKIKVYSSDNKESILLEENNKIETYESYWKEIYDKEFQQNVYEEDKELKINDNKKYYLIIINNRDEDSLNILGVEGVRYQEKIYLENLDFDNNSYKLFYGNKNDIVFLNNIDISNKEDFSDLILGVENTNALFIKEGKNNIIDNKYFYYYLILILALFFISWISYKIIKERKDKDIDDNYFTDRL